VVQPKAHDCCESAPALAHFIRQLPHVGLEAITAITPATAPPGLLDTPMSSVIEHGAWPATSKRVRRQSHRIQYLRGLIPYAHGAATRTRRIDRVHIFRFVVESRLRQTPIGPNCDCASRARSPVTGGRSTRGVGERQDQFA
jgi:hypothetical protein